jgi:murein DD-endopeptidase MepM/ murein hydrolase activator NlpD
MIENKELYSFNEPDDTLDNELQEPTPEEAQTDAGFKISYKTMAHIVVSIFCILLVLIIGRINSPWAGWTRTQLHTAINASSQNTFGYISNTPFFKGLILGGSRLIRLEEIRRMSIGKFPLGSLPVPDAFQNAVWPAQGNISKGFGWQEEPATMIRQFSPGVEFTTDQNAPVMSIADGEVASVKVNQSGGGEVVINHSGGFRSVYRPVVKIKVETGQMVKSGAVIAQTLADKVFLQVKKDGEPVDPFMVIRN